MGYKFLTKIQRHNTVVSEINSFLSESHVEKQLALDYISEVMLASGVDPDFTIEVMEEFGEDGKEISRDIKVRLGD